MNVKRIERFTKQPIPVNGTKATSPRNRPRGPRPSLDPGDGRSAGAPANPGQRSFSIPGGRAMKALVVAATRIRTHARRMARTAPLATID
jgi:hypothetical protein